ncbi:MAG: hypothetical protein QXU21_07525 [Candidatus Bathyarchaeia archaeon]
MKRNIRLRKFEAVIGDVEVYIYTPFMCNLVLPCSVVYEEKLYSIIEGFKVAVPEVLLILKAQAAQQRWRSEKGVKDRVDIISILAFVDLKIDLLKQLLEKYDQERKLLKIIRQVVNESRIEYKFIGLTYEKHGVRLKERLEQAFE